MYAVVAFDADKLMLVICNNTKCWWTQRAKNVAKLIQKILEPDENNWAQYWNLFVVVFL